MGKYNKDFEPPVLIGVYGSLKRGGWLHNIIQNEKYMGTIRTEPNFTMYNYNNSYPMLSLEGNDSITMEIYLVLDNKTLENLDRAEGYPNLYNRKTIDTEHGKVWFYYNDNKRYFEQLNKIKSGTWQI